MKLRLFALIAAALLLTGCSSIPQSGSIGYGPDVTSGLNNDEVYYSQTGPYQGAGQEAILSGFLNAGNGPQNDYAVAREYLTKSFATKWQPNKEVLIQQGIPRLFQVSETQYQVVVGVSGEIDQDGRYTELPPASTKTATIQFAKVSGQWRISEAPDETIVIQPNFKVLFRAYSLYFFDPSLTYLVPEVRWFPSRVSTGTRLMNALLKGPSDWLKPAVVNVIPVGTKLNINSVTIEDGVAQVDLTSAALRISAANRPLVKSQISTTLEQLSDVKSVEISIQRTPQKIAGYFDGQPPSLGTSPLALTANGLVRLTASSAQAVPGTSAPVQQLKPTEFAYLQSQSKLALVSAVGVHLMRLDTLSDSPKLIDGRTKQLAPSFDPQGSLWTLTGVKGSPFVVTGINRAVLRQTSIDGVPLSFDVSPEGARVAVLYRVGKANLTYVFPIERNKQGLPVNFGAPTQVTPAPKNASWVTWADGVTLAMLAKTSAGSTIPFLVTVGGQLAPSRAIDAGYSVVVNGTGQFFVLQSNGNVVESRGSSWVTISQGILALHVSGE